MQQGEQVLFELKRHPVGILTIYVMTGLLLAVLAYAVFGLAPSVVSETNQNQVLTWGGLSFFFFTLLCLIFNWIVTVIYWGNRWILTDDSLTQIRQTGLFHKDTSGLGLISVEDVTVQQRGILPHLFNYGTVNVETAGHHGKFLFTYTPKPTYYAQKLLEAREKEIMRHGHDPRLPHTPASPSTGTGFPGPDQTTPGH